MVYIILILSMFMSHLFLKFIDMKQRYMVYVTLMQHVFHILPLAVFLIIFYEHVCNNKYVAVCFVQGMFI
jgi:hypothetical protein